MTKATMNTIKSNWRKCCILMLCLGACAVLSLQAQQRAGTTGGGTTAGGFGGGGPGGGLGGNTGGGAGGGARGGATGNGTSGSRTYPANGTIPDAYFTIDPETRRVVVIAPEEAMPYVMQVLTNLDRPKPQVLIKVVFLEITRNNALDIGIEGGWTKGIGGSKTANASDVFGLGGLASAPSNLTFNAVGQPINSFQAAGPIASQGAGLYQILGANYQATLRAIAQAGNAKILSRPSILARNNQPAQIVVGEQVPLITSVSYNGLNGTPINAVNYENVGVILNVTPFITSDGLVEMIVAPQVSSIDPTLSVPISAGVNAPVIDTRSANTVAVTPDGQTVILGGLMQDSKSVTDTKIPFLGDIPLLGNLFKRHQKTDTQTELLIFLTPYIVQQPSELAALTASERARAGAAGELKSLSEKELNKFLDELPKKAPPK
jgi:general secretion pathway protein D